MSGEPKQPRQGRALFFVSLGCLLLALVLIGGLLVGIYGGRGEVIAIFRSPPAASYDGGPYIAQVETAGNDPFVFSSNDYELYVGRGGSYGHRLSISVFAGNQSEEEAIRSAVPTWTSEGFRLTFPSGHEAFVPAEAFTGGR